MVAAPADLLAPLRAVIERESAIELAVLFGSMARRTSRPDSDVDIAVLWRGEPPTLAEELALQQRVERSLGREVDIVAIDRAPPPLRWRIARDGELLCAIDPSAWTRLRIAIAIEHDELAETFGKALALQRRLLLHGVAR